jgi:mannose-6-phosphate isomerase class I
VAERSRLAPGREELLACHYFRIERLKPKKSVCIPADLPHYALLICLDGKGELGADHAKAGEAWFIPAGASAVEVDAPGSEWILTYSATLPVSGLSVT